MKKLRLLVALLVSLIVGSVLVVQAAPEKKEVVKSPGDLAVDAFNKVRDEKEAKPSPARFQQVMATGFKVLAEYPTHKSADRVIKGLAYLGQTMKEKNLAAQREAWLAGLKFELVNQRQKEGASEDTLAALAALGASIAGYEARESTTKESILAYEDKVAALAAMPGAEQFITDQEAGFFEVIKFVSIKAAEAYITKRLESRFPKVAALAKDELNLIAIGKQPYELKFKALDGREVDFAQLRGKVVLLAFWAAETAAAAKEHLALAEVYELYRKKGFEIVAVACDKEADREKLRQFVKSNRIAWPQYFDGLELKNEFGPKLNVRRLPEAFLFDQKGLLVRSGVRARDLDSLLKRLGIK